MIKVFENDQKLDDITTLFKSWFKLEITINLEGIGKNYQFLQTSLMNDIDCQKRYWFPYNKGGSFRKWYGNQKYLVNFKIKEKIYKR